MSDAMLMRYAAIAAGIAEGDVFYDMESGAEWKPLTDDGDALRLAAKLKIDIEWQATNPFPEARVEAYRRNEEGSYFCADEHEDNYRRAIVRAAAEIGMLMP